MSRLKKIDDIAIESRELLVTIFEFFEMVEIGDGILWWVLAQLGKAILYCIGWPVMFWVKRRGLWYLIQDFYDPPTYPYVRLRGESGVDWRKEGF